MEHFDLEDMFGRRQKANLELFVELLKIEQEDEHYSILIKNNGRGLARHAGLLMTLQNVEIKDVGAELQDVSHINPGKAAISWNQSMGVIHPNGIRLNLGSIRVRRIAPEINIHIDVTLYCEGMRAQQLLYELPGVRAART